jgi:hypothetical protein
MSDTRTMQMLERLPRILAVTATSSGLDLRAGGARRPQAAGERPQPAREQGSNKPAAQK